MDKIPRRSSTKICPITYERLAILMALAAGPIEKARIVEAVLADSVGSIVIKTSTAYFLIKNLEYAGYITVASACKLTDKGWRTLHQELNRIEQQRLILKTRLHV